MKIKTLLEQNGVQFVNRSYGQATTSTVTLGTLEKIEKLLKDDIKKQIVSNLTGLGYGNAATIIQTTNFD